MNKKKSPFFDRMITSVIKYNLQIIILFGCFLLLFEIVEPLVKHESITDIYHLAEILFYLTLLILVRILIVYLVKANTVQSRTLDVLHYKHSIGMELTKLENWDLVKSAIVEFPGRILAVEASRLHILNTISDQLELVAYWNKDGGDTMGFQNDCQHCVEMHPKDRLLAGVCIAEPTIMSGTEVVLQEICVPIHYGEDLLGVIQIKLQDGHKLTPQQVEVFENISPEIGLILKVRQEQTALSEMQLAQAALAERRTISTFIHDQLGQNLGYMHLKLDQLAGNENLKENKNIQTELRRLRDVANESYEIVRDILKTIRSETVPNITNLLQEQARIISRRASFELEFETMGKSSPLLPVTQQIIFFTFCEVLSNIEKHAGASKVDILVVWNNEILDITVADNGRGFEPDQARGKDHFGLQIMRERIVGVHGKLVINSSENSGTVVSISVPFQSIGAKVAI